MFQTFPNHQPGYGSLQECIPQHCPLNGRMITKRYFEVPHFQQIDITTRTPPINWDITTITTWLYNHLLVEGGSHQSRFTSIILYIYIIYLPYNIVVLVINRFGGPTLVEMSCQHFLQTFKDWTENIWITHNNLVGFWMDLGCFTWPILDMNWIKSKYWILRQPGSKK